MNDNLQRNIEDMALEAVQLVGKPEKCALTRMFNIALAMSLGMACIATAQEAKAMEDRTCMAFNEMVTALRAEGQQTIVQGDKAGLNSGPKSLIIYTSNADGTRGYEVGGDRRAEGVTPDQLCVRRTLANVQIHNVSERTIPANWRLPVSMTREQVVAEAERRGITRTADYNWSLDHGAQTEGFYPTIKASFVINGQPSNAFLDVRMNPTSRVGAAATVSANTGFSWQTDTLVNMGYGPFAAEQFRRRAQLAALTPRQ